MATAGKQAQDREIACLGLKAIVAELPPDATKVADNVVKTLAPLLLKGLSSKVCRVNFKGFGMKAAKLRTLFENPSCLKFEDFEGSMLDLQEVDAINASLEVLNELVSKFGRRMESEHESLRKALLTLLQNDKASHRKRTLQCLGAHLPLLCSCWWMQKPYGSCKKILSVIIFGWK